MTDTPPPLWERQETDTKKSYESFCWYRGMGGQRSLEKVSQKHTKNIPTLKKWSRDHNWQERVQAWDDHQDQLRRERNIERQKKIEDNAYGDYEMLRDAIEKYKGDYSSIDFDGVKPADISNLIHMMKQADDYARRAVGLPDKITESKTEVTGEVALAHKLAELMRVESDDDDPFA